VVTVVRLAVVVPPQNRLNTQQTPNPPAQLPALLPPFELKYGGFIYLFIYNH
jgi:hypothetical protein